MGLWYDSTDPRVINTWERELGREVRARDPLFDPQYGFSGKENTKLIQVKDALSKGPGSNIRTTMRYQLEGMGRAGNETLKGHGEGYKTATFNIEVNILRHYVQTDTEMVDQWVFEDTLDEGKDALSDWFATRMSFSAHLHAAGISIVTPKAYTLNNTIAAYASDYVLRPGDVAAGSLNSSHVFDVPLLNQAALRMKLLSPRIRPVNTPIGPHYCVFLSPEQVRDLQEDNTVWFQTMQNALKGGRIDDNPLLSNALGKWRNFLLFESDFVPPGLNSGSTKLKDKTRRAWIGGAQTLFLAYGRGRAPGGYGLNRYRWVKESEDFEQIGQIAARTIAGIARPRYQNPYTNEWHEAGGFVIETYADHGLTAAKAYRPWLAVPGVECEA